MKKTLLVFLLALLLLAPQTAFAKWKMVSPLRGTIKGVELEYKDTDTVTLRTGYGECNESYWEITSEVDLELGDTDILSGGIPSGEDFIYIYIDDSEATYPELTIDATSSSSVKASINEPSWSDAKQGWYSGDDRCIGVVWTASGSATIPEFYTMGDGKYIGSTVLKVLKNGSPTGSWEDFTTASDYTPVNCKSIYIYGQAYDANDMTFFRVAAYEYHGATISEFGYNCEAGINGWVDFSREWTRDVSMYSPADDSTQHLDIRGYQIER